MMRYINGEIIYKNDTIILLYERHLLVYDYFANQSSYWRTKKKPNNEKRIVCITNSYNITIIETYNVIIKLLLLFTKMLINGKFISYPCQEGIIPDQPHPQYEIFTQDTKNYIIPIIPVIMRHLLDNISGTKFDSSFIITAKLVMNKFLIDDIVNEVIVSIINSIRYDLSLYV